MIIRTIIVSLCLLSFFACRDTKSTKPVVAESVTTSTYYQEQHRNQYHFSPEANWMNDPNGMVYHDGEYHLFYQYYPDSTVWGPMHWGHAVSSDLVHWDHLPVAIYPDTLGYIFSGSAVIDKNNTAGFGKDAMVAMYTYHNMEAERSGTSDTYQYQGIAYSTDKGRTFTKYVGNPVIPNPGIKDFRDPKVVWDETNKQWVMVLAAYDKAMFYVSNDLKSWRNSGEFGIDGDKRLWECPDLFPIKVKGSEEIRWVLVTSIQQEGPNGGTATSYFVGEWDGSSFIGSPDQQKWFDYGTDNYAAVTWSNAPVAEEEVVLIGWMSNWQYAQVVPTEKWRSAMTLSRKVSLHNENGKYMLRSSPVDQLASLEAASSDIESITIESSQSIPLVDKDGLYKIDLTFVKPKDKFHLRLSNQQGNELLIGYDAQKAYFFIDRTKSGKVDFQEDFAGFHTAPSRYQAEEMRMTIYVDHAAVELFANEGRTVMTDIVFPVEPYDQLEVIGNVKLIQGQVTSLQSIWNP